MEVSLIGSSQVIPGRVNDTSLSNLSRNLNARNCYLKINCFNGWKPVQSQSLVWSSGSANGFSVRASASVQNQSDVSEKSLRNQMAKPSNPVKLFVGLPFDTVSDTNTINHAKAIAAGLKALKLLGVTGVELPVWWGIAEKEGMGKYDWTGYLAVVEMVEKLGLKLHVSLCFHASQESKIPLPQWVSRIGESNPNIYFTDKSGHNYKDCLSLSVDDLPVLNGKTPLEVYREFCENFKSAFAPFFGSTITGLSIGLGPDGELRYPSHHHRVKNNRHPGAGEFQCYDKYILGKLKQHAESTGNPLWGLGGPHDAPTYDQSPILRGFFAEKDGSWDTPYGNFFLSWYSNQLVLHGDRILSLAASTFNDTPITLSGKLPLTHSWYNARSHPSELTAGFYNTASRNGYDTIAKIFETNSCRMILPGMEMSDNDVPSEYRASPEALIGQIISSCRKHGVVVSGENSPISCGAHSNNNSLEQINKNLSSENNNNNTEYCGVDMFTYQRMGAYFFSPEHFPAFAGFVRRLLHSNSNQCLDDLIPAKDEGGNAGSLSVSGNDMHMHMERQLH